MRGPSTFRLRAVHCIGLATCLAASACGMADSVAYGRAEVRRFALEQDLRIDGYEADLVPIGWLGVSPHGTIAILQWQDHAVRFFDDTGALLAVGVLGATTLVLEAGTVSTPNGGPVPIFDVPDADALHVDVRAAGFDVQGPPADEPWGRQFNVHDPDGHLIAFVGAPK